MKGERSIRKEEEGGGRRRKEEERGGKRRKEEREGEKERIRDSAIRAAKPKKLGSLPL